MSGIRRGAWVALGLLLWFPPAASAQDDLGKLWLAAHYSKREVMIPMRDGVRLFTSIYEPREQGAPAPILMRRTPYSCAPYGELGYPDLLGPSKLFHDKGYVFVVQDVRGAYLSEGTFVDVRPHQEEKHSTSTVDESSDTYDTIAWLIAHVPANNGRVGTWGISYPGFYAAAGMIDAHPALKAVSPQAPIADWWYDDFHHHGALFLPHAFNFLYGFGEPRPEPTTQRGRKLDHGTPDGYRFFLDLGPLSNVDERWFHGRIGLWNDIVAHPDYDAFWQARNLLPHLRHVAPAVMTVGGWFDAEDLYGALNTYRAVEAQDPGVYNVLVMGPWVHGGWARTNGDRLGQARFGAKTSFEYQNRMELCFFEHFLRDTDDAPPPEASVFDTGANAWRAFDAWPPRGLVARTLHFTSAGGLSRTPDVHAGGDPWNEITSDPARPVPSTAAITTAMPKEYMTEDQRFVASRPDVLVYQTPPLDQPLTLAGGVVANLDVTTTGTDGDFVVKLIDVFPPDAQDPQGDEALAPGQHMGGYQMLVRSEVVRGRFREDPAHPVPFTPGKLTSVRVPLQDVLHTFGPGHRLMVQVHCTWFPLVDRNPQTFVPSIYAARTSDFQPARVRVFTTSGLDVGELPVEAH